MLTMVLRILLWAIGLLSLSMKQLDYSLNLVQYYYRNFYEAIDFSTILTKQSKMFFNTYLLV